MLAVLIIILLFVAVAVFAAVVVLRVARDSPASTPPFFSLLFFEIQSTFSFSKPMTVVFSSTQKIAVAVAGLLFHLLFWGQMQGVNLLLWYVACAAWLLSYGAAGAEARRAPAAWAVAVGGLAAAGGVVLVGSGAAKLATWTSLALLVGLVNQPALRQPVNALLTGAANVLWGAVALPSLPRRARLGADGSKQRSGTARLWYYGRLLGLPLVAVFVFHLLFAIANPRYVELVERVIDGLTAWLALLFVDLSITRVLFLVFGLALSAGVLLRTPLTRWLRQEGGATDAVQRIRQARPGTGVLALRKEYLAALAALVLLNGLLLVENALDIRYIWLDFRPAPDFDLSQFVHEGTWALVVSILLAMAMVLYFFRANLNFYSSALRRLRPLATVWVLQNVVLAVSVGVRNYHYISRMGLAYKRIGVCFFLLLTLFGLATVLLKVWRRRSAFRLVQLNSWAAYAVLLALALGNWEIWIARYNLRPRFRATLDREFLLTMPPRVLPELVAYAEAFAGQDVVVDEQLVTLNRRTRDFLSNYPQRGWLSWNWADERAYRALRQGALLRPAHH